MTPEQKDLAKYRMQRAIETEEDARFLLEKKRFNSATNRFYYAIFYAIRALLATMGLDSSKHSGVLSLFHKEFVKPGMFSKELSKIPNVSFEKRTDGDYEDYHQFSMEEVEKLARDCHEFLMEAQNVLNELIAKKNY
ncbi:MAG: HEPN domain-containing protein [bacterium]|jgi:uncharacterized protein (UPF0332 family)|nr:HEPN domain-containing protein [bacterium]